MKPTSIILLLLGLIAGPGYYFYCASFSGSPLDRFTVFTQDVSSLELGKVTVQSSGSNAKWNSPVTLELSPEMNPISVNAIIRYMTPASGGMKRTRYTAELTNNAEKLWEESFSISAKREKKDGSTIKINSAMLPKATTPIKLFSIEEPGQYTLNIEQKGEHDIAVAKLDMALRRNVIVPNMKIVMAGGAALLLAITGFILTKNKKVEP
ncbi:MAG: hypothetical protein ABFR47_01975 [Verrucomicrobiota bacterium]